MCWLCHVQSGNELVWLISEPFRIRLYQGKWSWNFLILLLQVHAQDLLTPKHSRLCFEENTKYADIMSKPGNGLNENAFFIHRIESGNIGSPHLSLQVCGPKQLSSKASIWDGFLRWLVAGPRGGQCFSPAWSRSLYLKYERCHWRVGWVVSPRTAMLPSVRK